MSFKTKALGLAAATALSITMVTGAMAAGSQSVGTSVQLSDGPGCSASITSAAVDFGTYTWDESQSKFVPGIGAGTGTVTVKADNGSQNQGTCTVPVTASAMTSGSHTILASDIALSGTGYTAPNLSVDSPYAAVDLNATLTLSSGSDLVAGLTYTGTISVGTVSGS